MATAEPIPSQPSETPPQPGRVAFLGIRRRPQQLPQHQPVPRPELQQQPQPQLQPQQQGPSEASTLALAFQEAQSQEQQQEEAPPRGYRRRRNGRSKGSNGSNGGPYSKDQEAQDLIAAERGKSSNVVHGPRLTINPTAVEDLRNVGSKTLSIDLQPSPSYNNWDDPHSQAARVREMDWEKEGPVDTDSSASPPHPRGKGKEKEKLASESNSEGRKIRQGRLPRGDRRLGQKPRDPEPNQTRISSQRRLGGNSTLATDSETAIPAPETQAGAAEEGYIGLGKHSRVPPPREFGGRLTAGDSEGPEKLRGEAPAFAPGKPVDQNLPPHLRRVGGRPDANQNPYPQWGPATIPASSQAASVQSGFTANRPRNRGGRRAPPIPPIPVADGKTHPMVINMRPLANTFKGDEQIGARIHREIASGLYECMVCFAGLTRKAKVWSCKCCWAVFHLNCIQKWAKQGLEKPSGRPIGADGDVRTWRCPGCNNPESEVPALYTCWCGGEVQPETSKLLQPHSCGQTCGKQRSSPKDCPHACDLQCHAGPCPPCTAIGPKQSCHCGKDEMQKRCAETVYEGGWSCEQVCGGDQSCGEHKCKRPCHPGVCGGCQEVELVRCFCGNHSKSVKCCDKQKPAESVVSDIHGIEKWLGYWECDSRCDRFFDCQTHTCGKPCHAQEADAAHCPRSPDVVTHCPCGKTRLTDILKSPRADCEAAIPACGKPCGKALKCGHTCEKVCHEGGCGVCMKKVEITCSCGRTTADSLCHQGEPYEPPHCMRLCKTALNCGRHECGQKCCSGEAKALERLASKRKTKPFNPADPGPSGDGGFEPEHICTRPCGRQLKCGTHACQMLCHRGPCGTCLEASFDELSCHCGRTCIQPPVPCGAKPPLCDYPCTRDTTCGHPSVPHSCHMNEDGCPKCPYLVEKICFCEKKSIKNVPCWKGAVSCGTECGRKLSCGSHNCHKICHTGDTCDEPCRQQCKKPKSCGHPCLDACHAPFQCSEDKQCSTMIHLSCACGGLKQEARCCSTKSNPTGSRKELKCNDQCRSRRMALALDLDPDRESAPLYREETLSLYSRDKKWASSIEEKFRSFAGSVQKRLTFPPMRSSQRAFLHLLAEDYGLLSESQDPEPYRSVVVYKGSGFTAAPRKPIAEYIASKPSAASASVQVPIQQLKKPRKQAYNAVLLQGIRVGMLTSEIEKELEPVLKDSQLRFGLQWTGDEEVLLVPKANSLAIDQIELELSDILSPKLKRLFATKGLADKVELVWVGRDGQIVNRESGGKWSLVAGGKSTNPPGAKAPVQTAVGAKSRFEFEQSKAEMARKSAESLRKKKKKEKEPAVVDNWETAADDEANTGPDG